MKPDVFPGRSYHQPSGKVAWAAFLRWAMVPFSAAAVLAWLMFGLFRLGHYYVGIVPAFAALAVAVCLKVAVNKGHCRSRLLAAAMGFCAGTILYLGYYYCGMTYQLGPETAGRFDLLPRYIRLRMHVDVLRDTHTRREETSQKGNVYVNWGVFGFETLLVLGITAGAALSRARKPYCESCGKWMLREVTHFNPARGNELLEAFRNSSTSLGRLATEPAFATVPSLMVALDFCPSLKEGTARDCPMYVSLKNVTRGGGGGAVLDPFDSSQGKVLVRALALQPTEIEALSRRFATLRSLAPRASGPLPEAESAEEGSPGTPTSEAVVEIRSLGADGGRVLTKRHALIGSAWAFSALLLLFGGLGLAAWGGIKAFPDDKSIVVSPESKALGITALGIGGLLFLGTAVFFLINPTYLGNRYTLKVVQREFARRTGCFVEPNDPDALFVEVVPKLNWGKMALESASDVGFLRVDQARREILFEGDKERWRIPAAAITSCEVEFFIEGRGSHAATKIFYVVLRARHPTQFWEAPLRERTGTGIFRSGKRKKAAEQLCARIRQMQQAVSKYHSPIT